MPPFVLLSIGFWITFVFLTHSQRKLDPAIDHVAQPLLVTCYLACRWLVASCAPTSWRAVDQAFWSRSLLSDAGFFPVAQEENQEKLQKGGKKGWLIHFLSHMITTVIVIVCLWCSSPSHWVWQLLHVKDSFKWADIEILNLCLTLSRSYCQQNINLAWCKAEYGFKNLQSVKSVAFWKTLTPKPSRALPVFCRQQHFHQIFRAKSWSQQDLNRECTNSLVDKLTTFHHNTPFWIVTKISKVSKTYSPRYF